jgi:predicted MPP superfamily phosphohydrolase
MKNMTFELSSTLMIILLCWIILTIADLAVCGLLKLFFGLPFKKAFLWGLLALLLPPAVITYGSLIERNCFRIKEITIKIANLPKNFDGYRIVHISDIHARSFSGREKHLQRAMDKINELKPDMVAFTGDLITMTPDELESHTHALGSLKARDGIFSVLGNHDYSMYSDATPEARQKHMETLISAEEALGWDLLIDENRIIRRGADSIAVIGVQNTSPSRYFPSKGNLTMASEGTEDMFRILLSHDPMHWEAEILGKDYPLTLSGHTHAMQFSLLGWCPSRYIFKQYRGLYSEGQQSLYVNIGLGETILPFRIGTPPEITLITLRSRSAN